MINAHARLRRAALLVVLLALLLAGAQPPAQAAPAPAAATAPTFTVNITADAPASGPLNSGPCETSPGNKLCSLRAAVMKANHWPGGGATIILPALPPGQTYDLTLPPAGLDDEASGDLNISNTVTLLGGGAGRTIIDGHGSFTHDRVFMVETNTLASLSGVTIQGGSPSGDGGGVYNRGRLWLDQAVVFSNTANSLNLGGGGLFTLGALTVTHSLIASNRAANQDGGGMYVVAGTAWLAESTLNGNHAAGVGGGIENDATLTVYSSTLTTNSATSFGGGLENSGTATLRASAITSNTALAGGGVFNFSHLVLVNSTLSHNTATTNGGGLDNDCGCATLVRLYNTTVANNRADSLATNAGTGGGLFNNTNPNSVIEIQNSLLANNFATIFAINVGYVPWPSDCANTLASLSYNLVANTNGCTLSGGTHDHTNVAALLDDLRDNGGPTWTQALLPLSPAIDAGNDVSGCRDNLGALLPGDQRGRPRTANGAGLTRCDIGAFEVQRTLDLPLVRR